MCRLSPPSGLFLNLFMLVYTSTLYPHRRIGRAHIRTLADLWYFRSVCSLLPVVHYLLNMSDFFSRALRNHTQPPQYKLVSASCSPVAMCTAAYSSTHTLVFSCGGAARQECPHPLRRLRSADREPGNLSRNASHTMYSTVSTVQVKDSHPM